MLKLYDLRSPVKQNNLNKAANLEPQCVSVRVGGNDGTCHSVSQWFLDGVTMEITLGGIQHVEPWVTRAM